MNDAISCALEFAYYGQASIGDGTYAKYALLRPKLREMVIDAHLTSITAHRLPAQDASTASAGSDVPSVHDIAQMLAKETAVVNADEAKVLGSVGSTDEINRRSALKRELRHIQQDQEWIYEMVDFKREFEEKHSDAPLRAQMPFAILEINVTNLLRAELPTGPSCSKPTAVMSASVIIRKVASQVVDMYPDPYSTYMAMAIITSKSKSGDFDSYSLGIFNDVEEMIKLAKWRSTYVIGALSDLGCGHGRYTVDDMQATISLLSVALESGALAAIDLSIHPKCYADGWNVILGAVTSSNFGKFDAKDFMAIGKYLYHELVANKCVVEYAHALWLTDEQFVEYQQAKAERVDDPAEPKDAANDQQPVHQPGQPPVSDEGEAAETDSKYNKFADYTSVSLSRTNAVADSEVGLCHLFHLTKFLDAELFHLTQISQCRRLSGLSPDTPMDKLLFDESGCDDGVYIKSDAKKLVLNFIGAVTTDPVAGCIKIGSAWGVGLFIEGTGIDSCSATPGSVLLSRIHSFSACRLFCSRL